MHFDGYRNLVKGVYIYICVYVRMYRRNVQKTSTPKVPSRNGLPKILNANPHEPNNVIVIPLNRAASKWLPLISE